MESPQPPTTPRPEDALEFLNNYDKQSRAPGLQLPDMHGSNKFKVLGVVAVIIILLISIFALFFGGNNLKDQLTKTVAQQEDLIRAGTLALKDARDSHVADAAANMDDFLATDRKQLRTYLVVTLKDKSLDKEATKLHDLSLDKKLTTAYSNNRLDLEFPGLIGSKLAHYKLSLQEARVHAKDAKLRNIIDQAIANINGLKLN